MASHIIAIVAGAILVLLVLDSAIQTFLLPRAGNSKPTRAVFIAIRTFFELRLRLNQSYANRDRVMALYTPIALLSLYVTWLVVVQLGYTLIFWGVGDAGTHVMRAAFYESASSLVTLGFAAPHDIPSVVVAFSESSIGLLLVAVLIAYLPTMYGDWTRRETAVTLLEVRAGSPPSAVELIVRFHRLGRLDALHELWASWEMWFADIDQSHTSLPALIFFRSPQANRSWVTASGAVLDAASLVSSTLDVPRDVQADLCIRAGYVSLRHIADVFRVHYNPDPRPTDGISITREQFDKAYATMAHLGVPLRKDQEQCWKDFSGWRVNYDTVLLAMSDITMAPDAPWSSDIPSKERGFWVTSRRRNARGRENQKH